MLATPTRFRLAVGSGEGKHGLNAFDCALLEADIGNINLLRVTSILPPGAQEDPQLYPPYGALVPTAYGTVTSEASGEIISAAIGIGFSTHSLGVIMEAEGHCPQQECEEMVQEMLREAFAHRDLTLDSTQIKGVEHRVQQAGAVIAAVILGYSYQ